MANDFSGHGMRPSGICDPGGYLVSGRVVKTCWSWHSTDHQLLGVVRYLFVMDDGLGNAIQAHQHSLKAPHVMKRGMQIYYGQFRIGTAWREVVFMFETVRDTSTMPQSKKLTPLPPTGNGYAGSLIPD